MKLADVSRFVFPVVEDMKKGDGPVLCCDVVLDLSEYDGEVLGVGA